MTRTVTVLFARRDSIYKTLPDCDVWDADRDARLWPGGTPVVAHPPCRLWGRLRHFARKTKGERQLAIMAVRRVRQWGGVLEHPAGSRLWAKASLPPLGKQTITAAGRLASTSTAGGTGPRKPPGCTSWAAPQRIFQTCPSSSASQPTWCRHESGTTPSHTSPKPSGNTRHHRWPSG